MISSQLNRLAMERKLKDCDILKACGFTRPTLNKIKSGGNINVDTLLALARGLNVKVGYFFDEEDITQIREAGRDYVEKGNIEHKGTEYVGSSSLEADLREQIAILKSQLADKERIIALMEKSIKP